MRTMYADEGGGLLRMHTGSDAVCQVCLYVHTQIRTLWILLGFFYSVKFSIWLEGIRLARVLPIFCLFLGRGRGECIDYRSRQSKTFQASKNILSKKSFRKCNNYWKLLFSIFGAKRELLAASHFFLFRAKPLPHLIRGVMMTGALLLRCWLQPL